MQPETTPTQNTTYQPVNYEKPKKGKKVLVILLVLLLISGAAAAGWWYGTDQATKQADQKISDLTAQVKELEAKNKELVEQTAESDNDFVVVKEWGVKLEPVAGMSYEIEKVDGVEVLKLTTTEVAKLGGTCDSESYLAIVSRSKNDLSNEDAAQGKSIGKIGDYYYSVVGSNGMCSDNPNEPKIRNSLIAAAQTLEAQ